MSNICSVGDTDTQSEESHTATTLSHCLGFLWHALSFTATNYNSALGCLLGTFAHVKRCLQMLVRSPSITISRRQQKLWHTTTQYVHYDTTASFQIQVPCLQLPLLGHHLCHVRCRKTYVYCKKTLKQSHTSSYQNKKVTRTSDLKTLTFNFNQSHACLFQLTNISYQHVGLVQCAKKPANYKVQIRWPSVKVTQNLATSLLHPDTDTYQI